MAGALTTQQLMSVMLAGSAVSAAGQISAAGAQSETLLRQAESEQQAADFEARQFRRRESARLASARAQRGASGVAFTGTPLLVDEATVSAIALNEAAIREQGTIRARNLRSESRNVRRAGTVSAFNTLLSAGGAWAMRQTPKAPQRTTTQRITPEGFTVDRPF